MQVTTVQRVDGVYIPTINSQCGASVSPDQGLPETILWTPVRKQSLFWAPLYRRGNWGSEWFKDLPMITQQVNARLTLSRCYPPTPAWLVTCSHTAMFPNMPPLFLTPHSLSQPPWGLEDVLFCALRRGEEGPAKIPSLPIWDNFL